MLIHIALILINDLDFESDFFRPINRILESRERSKGGHSGEAQNILQTDQ